MKKSSSALLIVSTVVGGAMLASACSGRSIRHTDGAAGDDDGFSGTAGTIDRGGTSGAGGRGGTSGTSGTSGTGGIPPTGGVAGTTFPGGSSGTSGTGGGPICTMSGGPEGTPAARRTIPFTLTPGFGGAGGAASEASDLELSGAGGIPNTDGCEPIADGYECLGNARATTNRGFPVFTFPDESTLAWTPGSGTFVAAPEVLNGENVYVEYTHVEPSVCPFCGSSTQTSLTIWGDGGAVIWLGEEGSRIQEILPIRAESLFGVPYHRSLACSVPPFDMDCYVLERILYDTVLETSPEQWISHATPTRVTTPGGLFDVMWASSEQIETRLQMCSDGRAPARDRGFAASRLDWH